MKITEDTSSEMLRIEYNNKILFYGNYWDYTRDGQTFKKLFENIGLEVQLEDKPFEEW